MPIDLRPRPLTLVAVLVSIVSGIALGIVAHHRLDPPTNSLAGELETFAMVMRQIHDNYVDPLDERVMMDDAIAGVMKRLDPHSSFLDRAALSELTEQTTGKFGGIGVELTLEEGRLTVIAPIDESPAALAGIHAGDVILDVDGELLSDITMDDAVRLLRGAAGTSVALTLDRPSAQRTLHVELTRAIVNVGSVRSRVLEPGIGYLRVSQFQNTTGQEVAKAIAGSPQNMDRCAGWYSICGTIPGRSAGLGGSGRCIPHRGSHRLHQGSSAIIRASVQRQWRRSVAGGTAGRTHQQGLGVRI
ncbi:MAG: PDZ domain-containing protein [Gammaproteobacteria bacterium]|nr:PDZ domain-containing protein [Gammaproteobacteria bacterium]